jgi:hypothetical protein
MVLTKLDRYLYEIDYKDNLKLRGITFDEVLEMVAKLPKDEREEVIAQLPDEVKVKIEEIQQGGLL